MKLTSRALLAAIAFSIAAVPMAEAQTRDNGPGHYQHHYHVKPAKPGWHAPRHYQAPKQHRHYQAPKQQRRHWTRGERVSDWKRRPAVRDWHRHGLKRPARGQQWIKVNNDYLLISLATGIIAGIVAGR